MRIILDIGVFIMNAVYCVHKLFPVKDRISMISRQSDLPSADAELLAEKLHEKSPDTEIMMLNRMIPGGILGKASYFFHMAGPEMHALATSRAVILEGYCIPASILHHRKDLKIVQMWHALGILKKFGYMVADTDEGYSSGLISGMHMHENYDCILASSEYCRPAIAEAFNYPESSVITLPLPRVDILRDQKRMNDMRTEILSRYPDISGRKVILYAPTFRKGRSIEAAVEELVRSIDCEKYRLIISRHPLQQGVCGSECAMTCEGFSTVELLSAADYVISDYSAVIFEAAAAGKPLYLYAYDLDDYIMRRGFAIDYMNEMPLSPFADAGDLMRALENDKYDMERLKAFSEKFVAPGSDNTERLAEVVMGLLSDPVRKKEEEQ